MTRPTSSTRVRPHTPVCWFALLHQARIDRNRSLYDLAREHLAQLGIHVSFVPAPVDHDDQVVTRIADSLFVRLRAAGVMLTATTNGPAPQIAQGP